MSVTYQGNGHTAVIKDPNNITPAECNALALCGAEAWNAWRNNYPVRCNYTLSDYTNFVVFEGECSVENFEGFVFGECTKFINVSFMKSVSFNGAFFGDGTSFGGARFNEKVRMDYATFGECVRFSNTTFLRQASFNFALFETDLMFNDAVIEADFYCIGSIFRGLSIFWRTKFLAASNFSTSIFECTDFRAVKFFSTAKFVNSAFTAGADFSLSHINFGDFIYISGYMPYVNVDKEAGWKRLAEFKSGCGINGDEIINIAFKGANINAIGFSGRVFKGILAFDSFADEKHILSFNIVGKDYYKELCSREGVVEPTSLSENGKKISKTNFHRVPNFIGSALEGLVFLEGANFPKAAGIEMEADQYSFLKSNFAKQQNLRLERYFFEKEVKEEREYYWKNKNPRWLLYLLYSVLSGHGFSFIRPAVAFVVFFILAFWGYMQIAGYEYCWSDCNRTVDLFRYTLQAIPFMGGVDPDNPVAIALKNSGLALTILFFHKLLSIIFLFLIGLALRNLFRMK